MEKVKAVLPAEKFASVKDDIQKQFDAILDEVNLLCICFQSIFLLCFLFVCLIIQHFFQVKEDFDSDLSGEAEVINLDVLKIGLNLLSEKLDKAVKDVVKAQEKLNKARTAISDATSGQFLFNKNIAVTFPCTQFHSFLLYEIVFFIFFKVVFDQHFIYFFLLKIVKYQN